MPFEEALFGTGMGLLLQNQNDQRQYRQQQKLQRLQIQGNKDMMDYGYQKQYQMWKDTNYRAQLNEMKAAGLSPGLMYGMKGGGGVTTGSPSGSVQGASAPVGGGEVQSMIGMGMQLELLKAQKENIQADTKLKEANATRTSGTQTKLDEANIATLEQGINNQRAIQRLDEIKGDLAELDLKIQNATLDESIGLIKTAAARAQEELRSAVVRREIDEATSQTKIKIIQTELIAMGLENALTQAKTGLTQEQMRAIPIELAQKWHQIWINKQQADAATSQADTARERQITDKYWRGQEWETNQQNANTRKAEQEQDAWVHDVSESTKLPMDVVEKVLQAIILKGAAQQALKPRDPRFYRRSDNIENAFDPNKHKR